MRTPIVLIAALATLDCGAPTSRSDVTPSRRVEAPSQAYPRTYPVLADDVLEARTRTVQRRNPGWSVSLDAFGFMWHATCEVCPKDADANVLRPPLTADDRARVETFLKANDDILAVTEPNVEKGTDTANTLIFVQRGPSGEMTPGLIIIDRQGHGTLGILGHAWPGLSISPAGDRPDAELQPILHRLDPGAAPDAPVLHSVQVFMRRRDEAEFHHVASLARVGVAAAWVDTRTGEDLTPFAVERVVVDVDPEHTIRRFVRPNGTSL
jgi:hypothetical protein